MHVVRLRDAVASVLCHCLSMAGGFRRPGMASRAYAASIVEMYKLDWDAKSSPDVSMADASSTTPSNAITTEHQATENRGPQFWRLFHMLFRNMPFRSMFVIHTYKGMFSETVYYAEQAQKLQGQLATATQGKTRRWPAAHAVQLRGQPTPPPPLPSPFPPHSPPPPSSA